MERRVRFGFGLVANGCSTFATAASAVPDAGAVAWRDDRARGTPGADARGADRPCQRPAYRPLSPFVTTLGMLSVARGMTYVLTQGRAQYPVGPAAAFTRFANGALLGLPAQLVSRSSRRWSAPSSGGPRGAISPDFRVRKKPAYWFRKPGWPCNQF
jgi:hypothetical protein